MTSAADIAAPRSPTILPTNALSFASSTGMTTSLALGAIHLASPRQDNSESSAAPAKARILACRSPWPVSSVTDRSSGPSGKVAIAVAGRPGRTGLSETPAGRETVTSGPCHQLGIGFGRRSDVGERRVGDAEKDTARQAGIDNRAAEKISGSTRHRDKGSRDQAAGGRFRYSEGLAASLEKRCNAFGQRCKFPHRCSPPIQRAIVASGTTSDRASL